MAEDVGRLTWAELNAALKACDDLGRLRGWLRSTTEEGVPSRVFRVYGRYSAVRRASELDELRAHPAAAREVTRHDRGNDDETGTATPNDHHVDG